MDYNVRLEVFYTDEHQEKGPFDAAAILAHYKNGYFGVDAIQMRIVCPADPSLNLRTTIGELREQFGREEPIPTRIDQVRPLVVRDKSKVQPFQIGKQSKLREVENSVWKQLETSSAEPQSPCELEKAGSELPPDRHSSRNRSESPTHSQDRHSREDQRDGSSCSRSPSPVVKKHKSPRPPFYPERRTNNEPLATPIAMELARILREKYDELKREEQLEVVAEYSRRWKIPERCKPCHKEFLQPSEFVRHAISGKHIMKLVQKDRFFTFEDDYAPIKQLISASSKKSFL